MSDMPLRKREREREKGGGREREGKKEEEKERERKGETETEISYLEVQHSLQATQTKVVVLVAPHFQPFQELLEASVALAKVHRQLPVQIGSRFCQATMTC